MISLIIPCIPEHLQSLELTLNDYSLNTIKPSETIISLSNSKKINNLFIEYLNNKFKNILPNFHIILTPTLLRKFIDLERPKAHPNAIVLNSNFLAESGYTILEASNSHIFL